jgi:para-aminobenzoate synthetase component 2
MFLMIDNYDSFVYNLVRYMEELNETIQVYRNDEITIDFIYQLQPIGIILSPGPMDPTQTGISHAIIREFADKIPILGVCLGHQTIAHAYGASIIKGQRPMHGQVTSISHTNRGVFQNLPPKYKVTRYHSLIIDPVTLPSEFIITAQSEDHVIMGIRHIKHLVEGVQFHPEAVLTEHGHPLLTNYITWCKEVAGL